MKAVRYRIEVGPPEQSADFFRWFDRWFLKRMVPKEAA